MRERGLRRALRLVDDLVVALQPVQDPELRGDDAAVVAVEQRPCAGKPIQSRFGVGVPCQRFLVTAARQRRVGAGDWTRPPRVRERRAAGNKHQRHDGGTGRVGSVDHVSWRDSAQTILLNSTNTPTTPGTAGQPPMPIERLLGSGGPGRVSWRHFILDWSAKTIHPTPSKW